ncbi:type 1 glutamine amidotransferase [Aquabacter cavernae]|uniref:type 1 glutamine amidotransferase n=1 Tax=Aquabacter cavernae TaxID=2496029 RepID=UPI000F8E4F7D|nr:type 1 glutamine amidotransferase [Aquabacter cavernae]
MRLLVFQHAASEHPGSFRDMMRADGFQWDTVALDMGDPIPSPDGYDALMVLGGPMDVWDDDILPWMRAEKTFIRNWVTKERPYLGICLGHQLLADALGGKVEKMARPEVGICDVHLTVEGREAPFLAGFDSRFPTLQWHGAAVTTAPSGARILAANDHCAIQALQVGPRAFSTQYHVEIIDSTVSDWGAIPEYKAALESITGPGGQEWFERAAAERLAELQAAAALLYGNFKTAIS